jgi:hypothetical protein
MSRSFHFFLEAFFPAVAAASTGSLRGRPIFGGLKFLMSVSGIFQFC